MVLGLVAIAVFGGVYYAAGGLLLDKQMVTAKIDFTRDDDPEVVRLTKKYGVPGLPYVVFLEPAGGTLRLREDLTVTGFMEPAAFLERLEALGK